MVDDSPISHPEDWSPVPLVSITEKIGSGATPRGGQKTYLAKRSTYALVRSQNVFDRNFSFENLAFISDEQAKGLRNVELKNSDILLNITGDGITFSRACLVPKDVLPACVNQHVSIIRLKKEVADPGYVLSYLTHKTVKLYIESFNAGGSRRAITKGHIESFVVPLPGISEQKAIAHILGTLDDRIELNRRMNETLEGMAQALFKNWFVDFDPVIDNALASGKEIPEELSEKAKARAALGDKRKSLPEAIRTVFPDEFTYSDELGWIPKGWALKTVSDFVEKLSKGTTPRKKDIADAPDEPNVPFLKVKDVDDNGVIKIESLEMIPRSVHEGSLKRSILKEGDILFSIAGTIGRTALVPKELHDANTNQAIAFIRPKESNKTFFLLQLLKSEAIQKHVLSRIVQAVQANVSLTELGNLPVIYPNGSLIKYWHEFTKEICTKILHNQASSGSLTKLRDTLLPKLLSGELRIPDTEKMVEEVN